MNGKVESMNQKAKSGSSDFSFRNFSFQLFS